MQAIFDSLRTFNYTDSTKHLWVFKRSSSAAQFTARFAQTDDDLNLLFLNVLRGEIARITEFSDYTYLSQTNENSCLTTSSVGSDFEPLKTLVDRPEPDWRVREIKDLKNSSGYVVKFSHGGETVYAVKKSSTKWKTSYLKTHINIIFANGELSAAEDNAFSIEKNFDFYVYRDFIFIASKSAFEAVMEHRASYIQAFSSLQIDANFSSLFTNMQPLIQYVGTNATQLRRMARIEQRSLYTRPGFLDAVKLVNARRNYGLNFDTNGLLVPCDQTVKTIIQILLDHRLISEVTDVIYDVPDATQI